MSVFFSSLARQHEWLNIVLMFVIHCFVDYDGAKRSEAERNGAKRSETERNGSEWSEAERNGAKRSEAERNGA